MGADFQAETGPRRHRLLVVDDEPINVHVLVELFAGDHDVSVASSGQQCLEACARELPDLILLDIVMAGMDGLEVCRRLKTDPRTRDIPVIFITGRNASEEETAGLAAGAVDFISKPINFSIVRARVDTHLTLKRQADRLRDLAFLDGLTGVANRRRFDDYFAQQWQACRSDPRPLSLMLIDIDHFKPYNDHYGHQAGDATLRSVAGLLQQALDRPQTMLARYGGEEFVCVLPGLDQAASGILAGDLCSRVAQSAIDHAKSPVASFVTISVGVASTIPSAATERNELLQAADRHLYSAKQCGRNQVFAG